MSTTKVVSKQDRKEQSAKLQKALKAEKTEGGALRRLKAIAEKFEEFNLSTFQASLLDNQDDYLETIRLNYSKTMKQKQKQAKLKNEGKELITKTRYSVNYDRAKVTLKTFGSMKKAQEFEKSLGLKATSIEEKKTPISDKFTPSEMLRVLQNVEKAFYKKYDDPKNVTVPMVLRATGHDVPEKAKENLGKAKIAA